MKKTKKAASKALKVAKKSTKSIVKKIEKKNSKAEHKMDLLTECKCCHLVALDENGQHSGLVLEVATKDKYAPKKTGVYNVFLNTLDSSKTTQQWHYVAGKNALLSQKYPGKALFEGFHRNLIVYKYKSVRNQHWLYDKGAKAFFNEFTRRRMMLEKGEWHPDANILTGKADHSRKGQRWAFEAC